MRSGRHAMKSSRNAPSAKRWSVAAAVVSCLVWAGYLGAADTNAPPAQVTALIDKDAHVISVGDELSYRVMEDGDDANLLAVLPTGEIELPYFGRFAVAGKKLSQARSDLTAFLEKDFYRKGKATVVLNVQKLGPLPPSPATTTRAPRRQIKITGAVQQPGAQEMPAEGPYMLSAMPIG